MLPPERELDFLRLLDGLGTYLKHARDPQKALRHALREALEFFRAAHGCVASVEPGSGDARVLFTLPRGDAWNLDQLARFIQHRRPPVERDMLVYPVRRRGGAWAALAVRRPGLPFDRRDGARLERVTAVLSEAIQLMDRERMLGVRDRIDRKIMEQIQPKDLFYQILDGLRSLTRYDHSSALLIREDGGAALQLVAEQIAWTKARSARIGLRLLLGDDLRRTLESGSVHGFDRNGEGWHEWTGKPLAQLAELLDYNGRDPVAPAERREASMLCAPLVTRDGVLGVLKVAGRNPGRLRPYDADLIERFRSQAAVAIQNLTRTESLRAQMLTAERKHAMAGLARSVSHDVNNALGSMLPLIQQMQEDLRAGLSDPGVYLEDLAQVQKSLLVCRRIFGGMLAFARGGARRSRHGHVRPAIDTSLAILKDGMERRGIEILVDMPDELPAVACGQGDLEQVFLNLLTNARDAMAHGGHLTVHARPGGDEVLVSIVDDGRGISAEHLPRVQEPFFTTKPDGHGLGLSICRSILWEVGAKLHIDSAPERGTRVDVAVPRAAPGVPA